MPSIPAWLQRKRVTIPIGVTVLTMAALVLTQAKEPNLWSPDSTAEKTDRTVVKPSTCPAPANPDPLLGARTRKPGRWVGTTPLAKDAPIVGLRDALDPKLRGKN